MWFRKKTKIEKLKEKYANLMRKSFEIARKDITKSKKIHRQADKLFEEISFLTFQQNKK